MATLVEQTWAPGATTAGDNISLPSGADPIDMVTRARLRSLTGGDAEHAQRLTPTPSKVDDSTITLNAGTDAGDELTLQYVPRGGRGQVP